MIEKAFYQHSIHFQKDIRGAKLTTLCVGGLISLLVEPQSIEELRSAIRIIGDYNKTFHILGNGSNLLIPDSGVSAPVIKLGNSFKNLTLISEESNSAIFSIGGSSYLPTIARELSSKSFTGLEFAAGIPATIGGAVKMNAGAHGSQISTIIHSVTYVDEKAELVKVSADEVNFGYRKSSLSNLSVVCNIEVKLLKDNPQNVMSKLQNNLDERKKHQPLQFPSCGSVFKNPKAQRGSAGALIESVGLKGYQIGTAQISTMHANWIVNPNKDASSADVTALIEIIIEKVFQRYGITLEPELIHW